MKATDHNPLDVLADSFLQRYRRGEQPSIGKYQAEHPELADQIGELFPALLMLEDAAPEEFEATGDDRRSRDSAVAMPHRLGDFCLVREVGRGGMGVVYEALQESLGRNVALKVLPRQLLLDAKYKQRFQREARAAAALHHTNIVPVFGVGEDAGLSYYAMQFIEGQSLDDVLVELRRLTAEGADAKRGDQPGDADSLPAVSSADLADSLRSGRFRPALDDAARSDAGPGAAKAAPEVSANDTTSGRASDTNPVGATGVLPGRGEDRNRRDTYCRSVARIGVQVASGLDYAHQQGVLHRDIKPSNLILDAHGIVWITDFGLAKAEGDQNLTRSGDVIGTLRYIAPEVFRGVADAKSDVYSLGLTLYEMLALQPAFEERDRQTLLRKVLNETPLRLRRLNREVTRDLELIVNKAIDRNPQARYATAGELAADLGRYLKDEPILARRPSLLRTTAKWARRHIAFVAAAVIVMLVLTIASAISTALVYREKTFADTAYQEKENEYRRRISALEREEQTAYYQSIALADRDWQAGDVKRAESLLDAVPFKLRNFEWRYLKRLCHADLLTLSVDTRELKRVDVSPDGQLIVAVTREGKLLCWEASRGQEQLLEQSTVSFEDAAFSPDGSLLAAAGDRGELVIWDIKSHAKIVETQAVRRESQVNRLAFSGGGAQIACGLDNNGAIAIRDSETGEVIRVLGKAEEGAERGNINDLALSIDGKSLAVVGGESRLWVLDAEKLEQYSLPEGVESVAFDNGGRTLLLGRRREVCVWDCETRKLKQVFRGLMWPVTDVAFSPDGRLAAAATGNIVQVWDAKEWKELRSLRGHHNHVTSVSFSADGTRLVSGSADGTVKLWDVAREQRYRKLGDGRVFWSANASPRGNLVAAASLDTSFVVWDTATGRQLHDVWEHGDSVWHVAFSPDGRTMASAGGDIKLWDTKTAKLIREFDVPDMADAVTFSPDGRQIAVSCWGAPGAPPPPQGTVRVFDVESGAEIGCFRGHTHQAASVAFSPDGKLLASACAGGRFPDHGELIVWDVAARKPKFSPPLNIGLAWQVAFSPDGRRVAVPCNDNVVRLFDVAGGREVMALVGNSSMSACEVVTFSHDGRRIATGATDGTIKLWDADTGQEILTLYAHEGRVGSVSFTARDTALLSASVVDKTVKLWDAPFRAPVKSPPGKVD